MDVAGVTGRAQHIVAVRDDAAATGALVSSALVAVREVQAWASAQHAALIGKLSSDGFPEATIAEAAKTSIADAARSRRRAVTLTETPALAAALDDGAITDGHVDAVTRAAAQLPEAQRDELLTRVDGLVGLASAATVDQFADRVRLEVRRLQADDGIDRLERQRRAARLSSWVDEAGMWNLRGRFDPLTGVRLDARLRAALEATCTDAVPVGCPDDPLEKQKFLAAQALVAMIDGAPASVRSTGSGRQEIVVVVDADAAGEPGPVVTWSIPVEIPCRVLAELAGDGDVCAVVVRNGVVLYAPGELDLGRTTRLASRPQRRALRGLYATCAIPGCTVHFDRCTVHHVIWWRHGGRTDLDNLLPMCSGHHHDIHDHGWVIELGPHRELTLRLPDGSVHTTGPPGRRTAA